MLGDVFLHPAVQGFSMGRTATVALVCLIAIPPVAWTAAQEFTRVLRSGDHATLSVFGSRPVDLAARALVDEFGIAINVEDPTYLYRDDIEDVGTASSGRRQLVPASSSLEMTLDLRADGSLLDARQVVHDLRDAANRQLPFEFRVDTDGNTVTLVPTRTRNEQGESVLVTPLLDRRVTIPYGTRSVLEHVTLVTESLQQQTGIRVNCCQWAVTSIPWGSTVVAFQASNEPARKVLLRLLRSEPRRDRFVRNEHGIFVHSVPTAPGREYWRWTMRCQPKEAWCFITVRAIPDKL